MGPALAFAADHSLDDPLPALPNGNASERSNTWSTATILEDTNAFSHVSAASDANTGYTFISYYDIVGGDL